MNYNAATHAIETPAGRTLARLDEAVSTSEGWKIAEHWGDDAMRRDLEEAEDELSSAEAQVHELRRKVADLEKDLRAYRARVEMLEDSEEVSTPVSE